jgi:hypothetical protein
MVLGRGALRASRAIAQRAADDVEGRGEEQAEPVTPIIPKNTAVPERLAKLRAGAARDQQRHGAEDEGERWSSGSDAGGRARHAPRLRPATARPVPRPAWRTRPRGSRSWPPSAISTTNPICVSTLLSMPRRFTPAIAASRHIGTIRMIASGRSGSHIARPAPGRRTPPPARRRARGAARRLLLEGDAGPFGAVTAGQRIARELLHRVQRRPEE